MLAMDTPMTAREAVMMNPLQLAYIGDTVWDLMVRSSLIATGHNVNKLHKAATSMVNAAAQAKALRNIAALLSPEEEDLVRRGRNTKAHHPSPKNQNQADYGYSTGLEALIGFLYLTGNHERLEELFARAFVETDTPTEDNPVSLPL